MCRIANHAVSSCPPSLLGDSLELSRCCEFVQYVYRQCEGGDYDETIQRTEPSDESQSSGLEGRLFTHFKESGLVLNSTLVLPLASRFVQLALPVCTDPDTNVAGCRLAAMAMEDFALSVERVTTISKCAQELIKYASPPGLFSSIAERVNIVHGLSAGTSPKMG